VGPDGNLWFSETSGGWFAPHAIGRITPAGAIAEFPLPMDNGGPSGLTVGPDGNLWFFESYGGTTKFYTIGRITPAGALTWVPLIPSPFRGPAFPGDLTVTAGPDGNLWISEYRSFGPSPGPAIVRITPAGAETAFPLPQGDGSPGEVTVGPDGNVWFTAQNPGGIGRIALDTLPPPLSVTGVVAVGPTRKVITSIVLRFDEALDPATVWNGAFGLSAGVARGQTIVFGKAVKIARVSYKRGAHAVRLRLAAPQKGPVRVTIGAEWLFAADGMSSTGDFTAVVA
jgi:hypothetical protein